MGTHADVHPRSGLSHNRLQPAGRLFGGSLAASGASPGVTYDLANYAGNVTYDGFHSYMYDAEGRLYEVVDQTICYTYDGDGDRMATTNCNVVNGGGGNTTGIISEFLYDIDHRLASQINISTEKLTRANIYAGSEFLAEDAPDAAETGTPVATQMRVTDQVGSLRSRWDYAGKQNGGCTSFPYGDGFSCTNAPVSTAEFTGKDRDNESALDYFGARYYSNRMGRFTTPDWSSGPIPLAFADFKKPQSLNLYSYTYNSPLNQVDKDGHCPPCIVAAVVVVAAAGYAVYEAVKATDKFFKSADATLKSNSATPNLVINTDSVDADRQNLNLNIQLIHDGADAAAKGVAAADAVGTVGDTAAAGTAEALTNPANATETVSEAATDAVQTLSETSAGGENLPDAPVPQNLPPQLPPQTRPNPPTI